MEGAAVYNHRPQLCGLITEGKDFQVAKVEVFQVGGGFRADVVVNGVRRGLVQEMPKAAREQ